MVASADFRPGTLLSEVPVSKHANNLEKQISHGMAVAPEMTDGADRRRVHALAGVDGGIWGARAVTLDVKQAAMVLKLHPSTIVARARGGKIPGAKLGKSWVFVLEDLITFIRSRYIGGQPPDVMSEKRAESGCHFTSARGLRIGGPDFRSVHAEYKRLLARPTEAGRASSRQSSEPRSGNSNVWASSLGTRGSTR